MAIDVTTCKQNPNVNIAILSGRLDTLTSEAVTVDLQQALEGSTTGILIDMQRVDYISSAGLRTLIIVYKNAQATGKQVAMIHVQPSVYKIFKVAGLVSIYQIFDGEERALDAMGRAV